MKRPEYSRKSPDIRRSDPQMKAITPPEHRGEAQGVKREAMTKPYYDVLNAVMAGTPFQEVRDCLPLLSNAERQTLLCSLCDIHNEIGSNSPAHAREIFKMLTLECPLFVDGQATCLV